MGGVEAVPPEILCITVPSDGFRRFELPGVRHLRGAHGVDLIPVDAAGTPYDPGAVLIVETTGAILAASPGRGWSTRYASIADFVREENVQREAMRRNARIALDRYGRFAANPDAPEFARTGDSVRTAIDAGAWDTMEEWVATPDLIVPAWVFEHSNA
jgi:hypothetical protein